MSGEGSRLARMGAPLGALARTGRSLRELSRAEAPDGSKASREIADWTFAGCDLAEIVEAYDSGEKSLVATEDLVLAVEMEAGGTFLGFALGSLLRSAMEASGRAWWLLDASIDGPERVDRFMNDVKDKNQAAVGFARRWLGEEAIADGKRLDERVNRYFARVGRRSQKTNEQAMVRGLFDAVGNSPEVKDREGRAYHPEQTQKVYWFLSNVTHGEKFALDHLIGWSPEDRGAAVRTTLVGPFEESMWLAGMAYFVALHNAVLLLGWDEGLWLSSAQHQMERLRHVRNEAVPEAAR